MEVTAYSLRSHMMFCTLNDLLGGRNVGHIKATHSGVLDLAGKKFRCYVLENGMSVLNLEDFCHWVYNEKGCARFRDLLDLPGFGLMTIEIYDRSEVAVIEASVAQATMKFYASWYMGAEAPKN